MSNDSSSQPETTKSKPSDSLRPWGIGAAVLAILFSFILVPAIVQTLVYFYPNVAGWSEQRVEDWLHSSPLQTFLSILFSGVATVAVLLWFTTRRKVPFTQAVGLGKIRLRDIGYTLLGMVAYITLAITAIVVAEQIFPLDTTAEQDIGFLKGISGISLAMAFAGLVIIAPIAEEIVFRGFLYGTLRRNNVRKWLAIVVTSLVFASLHLFGGTGEALLWIAFIDVFILSLILCYLRERTGTIWASIGVHAAKNFLTFLNLFVFGTR